MSCRILIVKLASLGDILATSPCFSALNNIDNTIDHLVDKDFVFLSKNNPDIADIIDIDTSYAGLFIKIKRALNIILKIRKKRYDVAFNFHRSPILGLILFLGGVKQIYGFSNSVSFLYKKHLKYEYKKINRTIQEFDLIRLFDANIANPVKLEYYIGKNTDIKQFNLPKRYIVCNPGGGINKHSEMKSRRWFIEYFDLVINKLRLPVVIVGNGKSDELLSKKIKSKNAINLVGKTNFDETALILKNALLYFGNDSSILFLAASQNIPTLGIFGPTQALAANPIGDKQYFIRSDEDCSPCYNPYESIDRCIAYICDNIKCMKNLKPEIILNKINEILKIYGE